MILRAAPLSVKPLFTALVLMDVWRREGWIPGAPFNLAKWARLIDVGICKQMICPGCGVKGMEYHAFQRHRAYRVLAVYERCGACEEF